MLARRMPSVAVYLPQALPWRLRPPHSHSINSRTALVFHSLLAFCPKTILVSLCSASQLATEAVEPIHAEEFSKRVRPPINFILTTVSLRVLLDRIEPRA